MANQNPQSSSTNIIPLSSRHDKNFEQYITDYALTNRLTMHGEVWESALAAAKRLDYAKRENRASPPNMTLIPAQAGLFGRVLGFFRRRQQERHLSELDDIRAFLAQAKDAAAQQSQINWGILRNGFGSWMRARLLPGGQQKGSSPTPRRLHDTPGWQLLYRRKLENGKKCLYVRGHLLHDAAGGVGVDYNLTPLTAASGGDFGANHANFAHRYAVEAVILGALANMHGQNATISEINYDVIADYSRPPRPQTAELEKIADAYKKTAKKVRNKPVDEGGSGGAEATHQHVINELALNPPSPHLLDAMKAIKAEPSEPWKEVRTRIMENLQLWKFEDQNVPLALRIKYSWVQNGVLREPWEETVFIVLPTSLAARFDP